MCIRLMHQPYLQEIKDFSMDSVLKYIQVTIAYADLLISDQVRALRHWFFMEPSVRSYKERFIECVYNFTSRVCSIERSS